MCPIGAIKSSMQPCRDDHLITNPTCLWRTQISLGKLTVDIKTRYIRSDAYSKVCVERAGACLAFSSSENNNFIHLNQQNGTKIEFMQRGGLRSYVMMGLSWGLKI